MRNNYKVIIQLKAIRSLMNHAFPVRDDYSMSHWSMWEKRIKNGHNTEQKWIEERYKKLEDSLYNPADVLSDDFFQTISLTNSMYATLVVAIWSEMEFFLKGLVRSLYSTLGRSQKDSYRFDEIKKAIKEVDIQPERCVFYPTVNAVRELNNSFKHYNGYCDSESCHYKQIKKSLLTRKALPDRRKRNTKKIGKKVMVEYSKLPFPDILNACNKFCSTLLNRVENKLKKHTLKTGKSGIELQGFVGKK